MGQWNNDFLGQSRRLGGSAEMGGPKAGSGFSYHVLRITAVTTNPTKGETVKDVARVSRDGKFCELEYYFQQISAGTAGDGIYMWKFPDGILADNSLMFSTGILEVTPLEKIGDGYISTTGGLTSSYGPSQVLLSLDGTGFYIASAVGGIINYVSSAGGELTNADMTYMVKMRFAVKGWSEYGQE